LICDNSDLTLQTLSELIAFKRRLFPKAVVQVSEKSLFSTAANGRGCVKTRNRPHEIVATLGEFSVEVSCSLTGRYRLVSKSIASHVVFEGDLWGEGWFGVFTQPRPRADGQDTSFLISSYLIGGKNI